MFNSRSTKNLNACRSKSESMSKTNFSVSPGILQEVFPLKRMSLPQGKLNRHTLPLSSSYYPAGIYQAVPGRSYGSLGRACCSQGIFFAMECATSGENPKGRKDLPPARDPGKPMISSYFVRW